METLNEHKTVQSVAKRLCISRDEWLPNEIYIAKVPSVQEQ